MKKGLMITAALMAGASIEAAELAEVVLVTGEDADKVFLIAASERLIEYTRVKGGLNRHRMLRAEIDAIYFYEPPLFAEALELYEGRDYAGARKKFAECREAYKAIDELPGNFSTLAGFYMLECCRKMRDLGTLKELLDDFQSGPLTREVHKNQEKVYILWDAVRTEGWSRLVGLADEFLEDKEWTGEQLAQIYFCKGQALEGLDRPIEALNSFNGAFTADRAASEGITRDAALACLRIYKNHEEVQLAIKLWGTEDEDPESPGYLMLQEAVSLCELWKKALGGGQPLPNEYAVFLKYKAKEI